jgi:hypothetical protein
VVSQDFDFVCDAICICYDQEPSQICVPRHSISGICPPGVLQDPPAIESEKDLSIVTEDQDSTIGNAPSVSVRSLDDTGKDGKWYFICMSKDSVNITLTNYCLASGYACPHSTPHGVRPKPLRPEHHDPLCESHSSCSCRKAYEPSQDDETAMIQGDLSVSNSLFVPALVPRKVERNLSTDRKYFSLACNTGNYVNASLTKHCADQSYHCDPGEMLSALQHNGPGNAQCSQSCYCRTPFAGAEGFSTRSLAGSEQRDNGGYTLRCGQEADQFYRTGYHVLSTRCQVIWGYSCDINGQVQHGGTSVFKCDDTCTCQKSDNSTVVGA